MICYSLETERTMKTLYNTLNEKDKRRYAAVEALKLGHGGIGYIALLFECSRNTISEGMRELQSFPEDVSYDPRIRKPGAGRKPYEQTIPNIEDAFLDVIEDNTAGDPMQEGVLWTNLSARIIAQKLEDKHGIRVSSFVIRKLLKTHRFGRRKAQKKETMKTVEHRNEQFENIAGLKSEYQRAGNPVISMDTKKKESIGNFYRHGHLYTNQEIRTYDHDFNSMAQGVVIPHGIYDMTHNRGYLHLGCSHDTSEFACDSLRYWWYQEGRLLYPAATSILLLCDGGGSNSSRHYIFKSDLQQLVDELGIEIRMAHYPPYCSKYNPIEHRLFPHVTRACQGVVFKSVELVKGLIEKTKTSKGLQVTATIIDKVYQTGRKVAVDFKEKMTFKFDEFLPKWNYTAVPSTQVI